MYTQRAGRGPVNSGTELSMRFQVRVALLSCSVCLLVMDTSRAGLVYFAHMPRKTPTRALKDISYTHLSSLSLILEQIKKTPWDE